MKYHHLVSQETDLEVWIMTVEKKRSLYFIHLILRTGPRDRQIIQLSLFDSADRINAVAMAFTVFP